MDLNTEFKVGDIVAGNVDLISDGDFGAWLCAKAGEHLVVKRIISPVSYEVYKKSIENPQDYDLFWVREKELDLVRGINEDRSNLAYVINATKLHYGSMDKAWDKVASILREFKKKKHAGFYIEVEELSRVRGYMVKVFKETSHEI